MSNFPLVVYRRTVYNHWASALLASVMDLSATETVDRQSVQVRVRDGEVMIDEVTVTSTDPEATSRLIHVLGRVILPKI
jgi:uncharacterized surface protein with fasciclin (FAS1) repeats